MKIRNLNVKGDRQPVPLSSATSSLQPVESFNLSAATRDVQKTHTINLQDNDKMLEFVFNDDTTWICDATTLHQLFPETDNPTRAADGSFELPGSVKNPDLERGLFGEVALKVLNVFVKKAVSGGVRLIAGKLEEKLMAEGEGLFTLNENFTLSPFETKPSEKPFLLFIHGTNSNTHLAFEKLAGSDVWDFIKNKYGPNILTYQHRTLTKSPLQNVLEIAAKLPDSAELHIISHSRGGLVGDILCRYAFNDDNQVTGFTETNIDLLRKEGNRESDIDCINNLNKAFVNKKIKINKFIRVACPASGTQLASKRLDVILNVFFNLLGTIPNIVVKEITDLTKELIAETLRTKDDVSVLPGIEAQNPDSPFIKILNDRSDEVAIKGSSLLVISGNGKLSASLSGLFVIVAKLFYWQRNDLVVNTDSMYLGANRKGSIQYFFDQGSDVDHFNYFFNHKTREAIYIALKSPDGEQIPGFTCVPQHEVPSSDRGELRGLEYGELYPKAPSGTKPVVLLLPGIMGSNLSRNGEKVWLNYLKAIFGGLKELEFADDKSVTATSLIKTSYKQLADRLSSAYDVVIYPFDWRKQLNDCAKEFNDKVLEILKFEKPVKIIGHSMGGVLMRDFIINYEDTWKKLNESKGFRLLFLGAPLGGSFRIPAVLFGYDALINSLNMLDRKHTKKELLTMFSAFPGILSLLPLTKDGKNDFGNIDTWKKMAEANGVSNWPIPDQSALDVFAKYRDNILAKRDAIDYTNMAYIAGKDKFTPCDYFTDVLQPKPELVFLSTAEGDQSVTWESGIPRQLIAAQSVYYADVSHGALANDPDIFDGIEEILIKGSTNRISRSKPVIRGEEGLIRMPPIYNFDLSERGLENTILGVTEKHEPVINQVPVSISVSNGDLAYASFPVLAGHFVNDGILYSEKSIDFNVNQSLSARHRLGLYPGPIGSNTIVSMDPAVSDFQGTIIVGLGEPGNLSSYLLTKTVEQGVAKYLLNLISKPKTKKEIGISALIIGCGYGGLTVETSLKAIIDGVNNANAKVTAVHKNDTKTIQYIEFIELYEDRALNCLYILKKIESKENKIFNIRIGNKKIKKLFGSKKRLSKDTSEEWWNRITVKRKIDKDITEDISSLVFGVSTGEAREEEKELFSSTSLIDLYIDEASTQNKWAPSSAKTLFELMIPNEFKDRLKKKGSICWILDKDTAAYPWELLQENVSNAKPLCIDAGMIRQLSTTNYRLNINRVATEKALVVADPVLDGFVSQLPGAEKEGNTVKDLMATYGWPNISLIGKTASEIVLNLFSNDFKIIHLAGHGIFNPGSRKKSGMVIGDDVFLTTADIEQLSTVPELVFVNCCHLGKVDTDNEKYYNNRFRLAANIGTELINIGVKAVIAAGWAVDDQAASDFANTFYAAMFTGENFGDAVREARSFIYEKYRLSNNTWGAYQCYGDPYYKLINRSTAKKDVIPEYVMEEEAAIDLNNLKNNLDTKNLTPQEALNRLKNILDAIAHAEIKSGEILEIEALIYLELGEYALAIEMYDELRKEENATFSVAALEKYCNCRGKKCVQDFQSGANKTALITTMNQIIAELKQLAEVNETSERLSLLGSAYKRKGMVTGNLKAKLAAYSSAASYYNKAFTVTDKPYALNNWIVLQAIVYLVKGTAAHEAIFGEKSTKDMIEEIGSRKKQLNLSFINMDYWQLTEDICYDLSLVMLDQQAAKNDENWTGIENKYKRIWKRSGSRGKKLAEIENFEILSDALSVSKSKHPAFLKSKIDQLTERLRIGIMES